MWHRTRDRLCGLFAALGLLGTGVLHAQDSAPMAALIEIEGAIGPATTGYFAKALASATERGARLVILRLDTPGGLASATRDIVRRVLNSPLPVACFVAPSGAHAASAGTYILYACHVAAMAPATNMGAATPVPISAPTPLRNPLRGNEDEDEQTGEESAKKAPAGSTKDTKPAKPPPTPDDAMSRKAMNDSVAYLRSLAEKRGRNADWAEKAVREGASLSAERALEKKVIDLIAADIPDLLRQIDGRKLSTVAGEIQVATSGMIVERFVPDWRMQLLSVLTNPTVAYILMLMGIYGLLLEGYHPGAILPGTVGAICLLLALYAFQLLPVNYVGLALVLLGLALMVMEALAPSIGVLGFGGVAAFVLGSVLLMDIDVPGYGVNLGIIAGIASGASALMGLTLYLLWRARRASAVTGDAVLIGAQAEVIDASDGEIWVWVNGERWRARATQPLARGDVVRVQRMSGLNLDVRKE